MTEPHAPTPKRMSKPRWLNARVIGGLVLVIGSVVLGARVIGASSQTTTVWAAGDDLAAGTVLAIDDLVGVEVNLGDTAGHYLAPGSASPVGMTMVRPVRNGELLAAAAVEPVATGRVVAIGVQPQHMPPGVTHGSVIDLYLTTGGVAGGAQASTTELIGRDITVQAVSAPAAGGLSGATSNRYQVSALLPAEQADALVRTLPKGEPIIVLVSQGAQ